MRNYFISIHYPEVVVVVVCWWEPESCHMTKDPSSLQAQINIDLASAHAHTIPTISHSCQVASDTKSWLPCPVPWFRWLGAK